MAGGGCALSGLELCTRRTLIQCDGSTHCDNENKVRLLCGAVHRCQAAGAHRIEMLQRQAKPGWGAGGEDGGLLVVEALNDPQLRLQPLPEKPQSQGGTPG